MILEETENEGFDACDGFEVQLKMFLVKNVICLLYV